MTEPIERHKTYDGVSLDEYLQRLGKRQADARFCDEFEADAKRQRDVWLRGEQTQGSTG
jgi:hypothetical protein